MLEKSNILLTFMPELSNEAKPKIRHSYQEVVYSTNLAQNPDFFEMPKNDFLR